MEQLEDNKEKYNARGILRKISKENSAREYGCVEETQKEKLNHN